MKNRLLYDRIYANNLDLGKYHDSIGKMSKSRLITLMETLSNDVQIDNSKSNSNFDLIANSSLSGLESQCIGLECRVNRLNNLIRKATLYANKVWVQNPLEKYENPELFKDTDAEKMREFVIKDIYILHHYKPLIDNQIFTFAKSQNHFCLNCFGLLSKEHKVNTELIKKVKILKKEIKEKFVKGADFFIREIKEWRKFVVEIVNCDLNVFEHEESFIRYDKLPDDYKKAIARKSNRIYKKEMIQSDDADFFANSVLSNIIMQNWYSTEFGANYVTDQPIEYQAIERINENIVNRTSNSFYSGLQHTVPIIKNIRIEKLIELRIKEPEAFANYRNSFDRFLNDHKDLNELELKEAFSDEIQPQIDQLNQSINYNKRKLIKNAISSLVTGGSIISIAMFGGILPVGISQAVSGLAGFHQGSKLIENLISLGYNNYEEKDNKFYFLWKAIE